MTAPTKQQLALLDDVGRRVFCREGHRIEWTGDEITARGLCSAADTWSMTRWGSGRRLEDNGKAGWRARGGQFDLKRHTWWASHADGDPVDDELKVAFNCSHNHYPLRSSIALGDRKAYAERFATYPAEVKLAHDALTVREAIEDLTKEGWDFLTDQHIRCPLCMVEERELEATLARLAAQDAAP